MPRRLIDSLKNSLSLEKQRDYRNIVLVQVIIIVFGLTLTEFLEGGSKTAVAKTYYYRFLNFWCHVCFFAVGSP